MAEALLRIGHGERLRRLDVRQRPQQQPAVCAKWQPTVMSTTERACEP